MLNSYILFSKSPEHLYIFSLLMIKKGIGVPAGHQARV